MPRPRRFASNAERQKAYRARQAGILTPQPVVSDPDCIDCGTLYCTQMKTAPSGSDRRQTDLRWLLEGFEQQSYFNHYKTFYLVQDL
jgi:hypothetical protein